MRIHKLLISVVQNIIESAGKKFKILPIAPPLPTQRSRITCTDQGQFAPGSECS